MVHTCEGAKLVRLLGDAALRPNDDPTSKEYLQFDEALLFFYYGRPAFRKDVGNVDNDAWRLCCLVLADDDARPIKRVLPFDSGAFERYEQWIHQSMDVRDFEAGTSLDAAARIVSTFFGTNERYYRGKPLELVPGAPYTTASCYATLIRAQGRLAVDDRRRTIEVQVSKPVSLDKKVLAVVLPQSFVDDAELRRVIISEWGAEVIPYESYTPSPAAAVETIFARVDGFLRSSGAFG